MKAFVIQHDSPIDSWFYRVATNYTKLNFDYCMADRFKENAEWQFFESSIPITSCLPNFEFTIVVKPGTIFPYSFYQRKIEPRLGEFQITTVGPAKVFHSDIGLPKEGTLKVKYQFPYINPTNEDTFSSTHDQGIDMLLKNSNLSYVVHNEIPEPVYNLNKPIKWAMTVSSGFYINYILHAGGFDANTIVNHIDISKSSLEVRKYTIENWNGIDYLHWIDHLYEKFPLLNVFNGEQFRRGHKPTHVVLDHMSTIWSEAEWIKHWQKYQTCTHNYYTCNFADTKSFKKILSTYKNNYTSVFWYNGALKRMPANINKTSDQSHKHAKTFMQQVVDYNPSTLVYGSDHCCAKYNGISALDALNSMKEDSRLNLWRTYNGT